MERCWCGKAAVIHRRYEGSHLCKRHFCESVERKVKRTIRENMMVQKGDRIAIGVSGSRESMALLYMMNSVFGHVPGIGLTAVSVDEGISGYRKGGIRLAGKLCRELGIDHRVYSFRDAFGKTMDRKASEIEKTTPGLKEPCTHCGIGRRYVLNRASRELNATKLCVGHTLDDEAQSVVMNYIRGDMPRASRLGPVTDFSLSEDLGHLFTPRIKPLRMIPDEEVALYAGFRGFDAEDKRCPYESGIRIDVLGFINAMEEKYPGIRFSILETFDRMLPAIRSHIKKTRPVLVRCRRCGEPSAQEICKTCELWR